MTVVPIDFLLLLAPLAAAAQAPATRGAEVTVVGRSLAETRAALKQCWERHCPPGEEIDAAMDYAETQFIAGDLMDARQTLSTARHRNERYAREMPVKVANMVQFSADLAALSASRTYRGWERSTRSRP